MISPYKYILYLFKNFQWSLFLLLIHPFITSFFLIFPSFVIKNITDGLVFIDKIYGINFAIKWVIIYFAVTAINFLYCRFYQYFMQIKLFPVLRKNATIDCISSLIENSKLFFNTYSSGEIAHFLIHLNEYLSDFISLFFEKILHNIFAFIFIVISLFYCNFYCGLLMGLWLLLIFIIIYCMVYKINKISTKIIFSKALITKMIVDLFDNINLVKVFCNEKNEINLLDQKSDKLLFEQQEVSWYYLKICALYYFSFGIMEAISLFILLNQYKRGNVTSGDIVFWWMLAEIAAVLADNLINDVLQLPKQYFGIEENLQILKKKMTVPDGKNNFIFKEGKIEFKDVSFSFSDKIILKDFSLIIHPKEKIALVGFSGSGKTTLIFLLLRMYVPDKGAIYIDDQDLVTVKKESLYQYFSVILQESNILERSFLENILYSHSLAENDFDREKINKILSLSALEEFRDSMKKNNSKILSGGQKQRVAIARAFYKEASIFLFDEPTSSLDPINENIIMQSIQTVTENKTLILITHKLNIINWVPRILVFDQGKIVQEGSHEELKNKDGLYKKLLALDKIS